MKKFVSVSMSRVKDGRGLGTAKGEDLSYYSNRLSGQLSLRKRKIKNTKICSLCGNRQRFQIPIQDARNQVPELSALRRY